MKQRNRIAKIVMVLMLSLSSKLISQTRPSESAYQEQEVQFTNGNTILSGSLLLPKSKRPCPVVIFVHGDGPTPRDFYGYYRKIWAEFATKGVACFAWDKPGVGKSFSPYGTYDRQYPISFFQRAAEVRKAIDYLKSRGDIDSTQIGTWAISQGGWISSMIASQTREIAFMIEVSCAGQPAVAQSKFQIESRLKDEGKSMQMIREELQRYQTEINALAEPKISDEFLKFLSGKPNNWKENYARSADDDGSFFIDPVPYLEKIKCPVLVIFGDKDRNVNYEVSLKAYTTSLRTNPDVTTKVFSNADHILFNSSTGKDSEWRKKLIVDNTTDFVEGYLQLMSSWLQSRVRK